MRLCANAFLMSKITEFCDIIIVFPVVASQREGEVQWKKSELAFHIFGYVIISFQLICLVL